MFEEQRVDAAMIRDGRFLAAVGLAVGAVVLVVVVVAGGGDSPDEAVSAPEAVVPSLNQVVEVAKGAGVGSPRRPVLPEPADAGAVVSFLAGEGAALVEFEGLVGPLVGAVPPAGEECLVSAQGLDGVGSPQELLGLAAGVPDPVTSELLVDLSASTGRFLGACRDGDERLRAELAFQWVLLERRLDQLGVDR